MPNKPAVKSIIDTLGEDAICSRFGVLPRTLRHVREDGSFAASWYAGLSEMCASTGIECPLDAFNWKGMEAAE